MIHDFGCQRQHALSYPRRRAGGPPVRPSLGRRRRHRRCRFNLRGHRALGRTYSIEERQRRGLPSSLQFEQRPFPVETTAVPGEASARADDPVAGHDDGNRVVAVRQSDGTGGAGAPICSAISTVGPGLTERDRQQRLPDSPLKLAARADRAQGRNRCARRRSTRRVGPLRPETPWSIRAPSQYGSARRSGRPCADS